MKVCFGFSKFHGFFGIFENLFFDTLKKGGKKIEKKGLCQDMKNVFKDNPNLSKFCAKLSENIGN